MSNFQERIREEYGVVSAFIASHPKLCVVLSASVFFLLGTFF